MHTIINILYLITGAFSSRIHSSPPQPQMILKFGTSDILNTTLIDPRTRSVIYNITTLPINEEKSPSDLPLRRTCIYDTEGCVVGKIGWQGQQPQDIAIVDETVGDLTRLFGSSTVRFQ